MAMSIGYPWRSQRSAVAPKLRTVIVTLRTGTTIRGVLRTERRDALVLHAASQVQMDQGRITWAPIGGDVVVPMENIDYWQEGIEPAVVAD